MSSKALRTFPSHANEVSVAISRAERAPRARAKRRAASAREACAAREAKPSGLPRAQPAAYFTPICQF